MGLIQGSELCFIHAGASNLEGVGVALATGYKQGRGQVQSYSSLQGYENVAKMKEGLQVQG